MLDPLYQYCTDKEYVKDYIAGVLGPGFTPETYSVLRSDAEIGAFTSDRAPCVIKPTHASGQVVFRWEADEPVDRDMLRAWLRLDHYRSSRESNYRHLTPKIIVEEFLSEDGITVPKDYKLYCFHGVPKMIQVTPNRFGNHNENYYDPDWNRLPMTFGYPNGTDDERPSRIDEMLDIAARLAEPFPFVRVDLYASRTWVRVGELTFCPTGARARIHPDSADLNLGRLFSTIQHSPG